MMVALVACSGESGNNETQDNAETSQMQQPAEEQEETLSPELAKGKKLMEMSTCPTCHLIEDKIVGPSYQDVAERYAEENDTTITYLAGKVIQGGKGNWGEVPMTPNPQVSQEEAESMVEFILSLND